MYRILYEKRVFKDLDKIPDPDVVKILALFKELPLNPLPVGSVKLSGRPGLYRARQGDYRIVYAIDHKAKEIRIILVGHRKEVYRNL